jgi:hypothetical protein
MDFTGGDRHYPTAVENVNGRAKQKEELQEGIDYVPVLP